MKKIFLYSSIAVLFMSCNLDREPMVNIQSDELLSNPNSLNTVTNGNYALLKGDADGGGFYNNLHRVVEYGGDNISISGTTTDPFFYMYNYKSIKTNSRDAAVWTAGYKCIIGCNKVIGLVKEGDPKTDQLVGENYFLRAYTYFELVNVFGRPYIQGAGNLGVPLKTGTDVTDLPPRATVGQVYTQIIADLQKAEALMSDNSSHVRATKIAAQGLLSRVYLYMGNNVKAAEYASKVIDSGERSLLSTSELPDYVKKEPEANNETILAFKYNKDGDYNHGWYTVGSMYASIDGVGWGEMYASSTYLDLLDQNPGDARRKFIQAVYTLDANGNKIPAVYWVDSAYKYQFRRTYVENSRLYFKDGTSVYEVMSEPNGTALNYYYINATGAKVYVKKDFDMDKRNGYPKFYILKASQQSGVAQLYSPIILRLAEMYLNRAEAYAKAGNVAGALADLNVIRTRAGIPAYSAVPAGKTLLQIVADERRAELAFEAHRKFDVFRNNETLNRRYPGSHLSGGSPFYEVLPSNNRIIEYLPESQIIAQPNLVQNPD